MKKREKVILSIVLLIASMTLITVYSNWQTSLGVFLFGWMLNIDNGTKDVPKKKKCPDSSWGGLHD